MLDPTEYDPNSKESSDDPNFLGDNDHGDAIPKPKCASCGVPWADHMGIMGVCLNNKALKEDLKDLREEISQLTKDVEQYKQWLAAADDNWQTIRTERDKLREERDEANSLVCRILSEIKCRIEHGADSNGHLEGLDGLYEKETP